MVTIYQASHDLINNKGAMIWCPRSAIPQELADADVYAESTTQIYPLGSWLEFADGRGFRYGKCGSTSTTVPLARTVVNSNLVPGSAATNGFEGSLDSTSDFAVGSTVLVMNDTTDRALNAYEDGMATVFPAGHICGYRIAGSDVATSVDDVTIYLDDPNGLQTAMVVDSTGITAYPSIFSNLVQGGSGDTGFESCMGIPLCDSFTSGSYMWIQRRGHCWITPTAFSGDTSGERAVIFYLTDGTIAVSGHGGTDTSTGTQVIGYLTQKTVSGYGDAMVWLQLE